MRTNWVKWACVPLALAGLMTSFESGRADGATEYVTPGAPQYPLDSLYCSSTEACVGIHGQFASTTSDGGLTWRSARLLNHGSLEAMACPTPRTCYAVGWDAVGDGTRHAPHADNATVLRTTDGGKTWTQEPPRPRDIGGLSDISCPTRSYCLAVGASPYSASHQTVAVALVTRNSGRTWRRLVLPKGETELSGVTCSAPRVCLAVDGADTRTISTDNGGTTWTRDHGSPGFGRPTCIGTHCLMVGTFAYVMRYVNESTALIFESTNGGHTWASDKLPGFGQSSELNDVTCVSATDCVAVGGLGVGVGPGAGESSGITTQAAVLTTHNGGATWIAGSVPPSVQGLSAISCPTATSCMAVGYHSSQHLTVGSAAVLVTHDSGATWTAEW
jgi:photosystem II stability/assembly factor-like uncharacterized protein